jgi:hypothetical protein
VLSIKGTTLQGPTSKLDKFNDNLWVVSLQARSKNQSFHNNADYSPAAVQGLIYHGYFGLCAIATQVITDATANA